MTPLLPATARRRAVTRRSISAAHAGPRCSLSPNPICGTRRDRPSPLGGSQHSHLGVDTAHRVEYVEVAPRCLMGTLRGDVGHEGELRFLSGALLAHAGDRDVMARKGTGHGREHAGL